MSSRKLLFLTVAGVLFVGCETAKPPVEQSTEVIKKTTPSGGETKGMSATAPPA